MKVEFREITPANFRECVNLKVAADQTTFVASNVYSIAQAKVFSSRNPFAVYAEDQMVGFVMYGFDEDDGRFYLGRLMIDEKFQGKGYGKAATLEVLERMRQIKDCKEVYLSFVPQNEKAEKLYESVGFKKTGELEEGEVVMRFEIEQTTNH